jgi:DNA end-binding protein Ku
MVGIGRVVMARRERVMMLEPFGKGIMGTTLHYPYEIRSEESVFEEIPEMKLRSRWWDLRRLSLTR